MPNLAYTQYIIVGPKPSLQQASQFMERFIGKWLDEPITALGVDPNADGIECRGWVDGVYPSEDCLEVYTQSAWRNHDSAIEIMCHHFNLKFYYISEEFGCDWFVSNDINHVYFDEEVYVDMQTSSGWISGYYSPNELLQLMADLTGCSISDVPSDLLELKQWALEHGMKYCYLNACAFDDSF